MLAIVVDSSGKLRSIAVLFNLNARQGFCTAVALTASPAISQMLGREYGGSMAAF